MNTSQKQAVRPDWVELGLWQIRTRSVAMLFCISCIALLIVSATLGVVQDPKYLIVSLGCLSAAVWYWLCIKWVDKHGTWQ
jgi:hypothetical protein